MNNSQAGFEPSLAKKTLQQPTRKAPRILGGRIHPGLVHTASPERDVALTFTAFALEGFSLVLLWSLLPFHPGMVAGLAAFDTAGALLTHAGVGDANLRRALVQAADTPEEEAAVEAQRPGYFKYLRALGVLCIVLPFLYKVSSIFMLPMALRILGGFAPALLVSFTAVAVIHLFFTGYGLAHLRYRRAEKRERDRMLCSDRLARGRDGHPNRIKAARTYRFQSFEPLKNVDHCDGHSLRSDGRAEDGSRYYVLTTRGRFDDPDLDFMINAQQDLGSKAELCLHGLRQQLAIEQSEPLTSSEPVSVSSELPIHDEPMSAVSGEQKPADDRTKPIFRAAATVLAAFTFGLTGCIPEKPESLKMTLVATKPMPAANGLPECALAMLAPPKPFAGKFIPLGELLRLDLKDAATESLEPADERTAAEKKLEAAWQIQSAEIELAKTTEALGKRGPGLFARIGAAADSAEITRRIADLVTTAQSEGREVIAVSKAAKDGQLRLTETITVSARPATKEACAFIDEKLKASAPPSVLVLLDPPFFVEPAPAPLPKPEPAPADPKLEVTKTKEETHEAPPLPQPETKIVPVPMPMPGSSNTFFFDSTVPGGTSSAPRLRLPAGARLIGEPLHFEKASAKLTRNARRVLDDIVATLKARSCHRVILVASADYVGSERDNLHLANARADVVRAALLQKEIVADVISVGENLAREDAARAELQQDRTVSVYVTDAVVTL